MTVLDVNTTLAVVLVLAASAALAVWVSPMAADWVSLRLIARSRALRAARVAYEAEWKGVMREG